MSGSNQVHGTAFYFLRDNSFGAQPVFLDFKPNDRQHQDRLPGYGRNAFLGPDYATADLRLTRRLYLRPRYVLSWQSRRSMPSTRDNRPVTITDDGFNTTATDFVQADKTIGIRYFPAYYQRPANLVKATSAYAPRQLQFGIKLSSTLVFVPRKGTETFSR